MKKHYETHVEDTDKLISVAGPVLDYKSWYEQYRKLMEEQAQRKYGLYTPTSEGDDDFPSISGMIARYSALGLTNEQMAENPVWKDLTGNGHDLQMKNFAWKGMSGVGGYKFDFLLNEWATSNDQISEKYSYKIVINNKQNSVQLINNSRHIKITLKITGIEINKSIFRVYDNAGMEHKQDYTKDGIYEIDYTANEGANRIYFYVVGGNMGQLENPITIEQLPLYPGALVFDGVDDYGVCENFPILTKEKGYTVVALRQWLSFRDIGYPTLVVNSTDRLAAFSFEDFRNETKSTWNWGRSVELSDYKIPLLYTYQTSTSYNSKTIYAGAIEEGSNILQVCRSGSYCANAAIWEIVILDHDATEEELTKIKDYFVKIYPWLFPDQAWTVTGKTNEDEDRATIANITGNGNDLILSNFGFAEGSGYGLYKQNFSKIQWTSPSARVEVTKTNSSFNITEVKSIAIQLYYLSNINEVAFTVPSIKVRIVGLTDGQSVNYRYFVDGVVNYFLISSDGIYDLPAFEFPAKGDYYGFEFTKIQSSCNITIEQIPEYEGYLVTDGVDDKIVSSVFGMGKDFTIVGDWKFIDNKKSGTGLVKGSSFYIYNTMIGLDLYINSRSVKNSLDGIKSINAACSDGRAYDRNWNEILANTGNVVGSGGMLEVSSNGGRFDRIAFKNLAIYPRILSKDDCIKAYNYLQTLKAK